MGKRGEKETPKVGPFGFAVADGRRGRPPVKVGQEIKRHRIFRDGKPDRPKKRKKVPVFKGGEEWGTSKSSSGKNRGFSRLRGKKRKRCLKSRKERKGNPSVGSLDFRKRNEGRGPIMGWGGNRGGKGQKENCPETKGAGVGLNRRIQQGKRNGV